MFKLCQRRYSEIDQALQLSTKANLLSFRITLKGELEPAASETVHIAKDSGTNHRTTKLQPGIIVVATLLSVMLDPTSKDLRS